MIAGWLATVNRWHASRSDPREAHGVPAHLRFGTHFGAMHLGPASCEAHLGCTEHRLQWQRRGRDAGESSRGSRGERPLSWNEHRRREL